MRVLSKHSVRPSAPVVIIALLLGASTIIGWWAWNAAQLRYEGKVELLRSHADFAATRFSSRVEGDIYIKGLALFTRAGLRDGNEDARVPRPPAAVVSAADAIHRCKCAPYLPAEYAFRVELGVGEVIATTEIDSLTRSWLAREAMSYVAMLGRGWDVAILPSLDASGTKAAIVTTDRVAGGPRFVYGVVVDSSALAASVFRPILDYVPLLGGSWERTAHSDSLVAIRVADATGRTVFRTAAATDSSLVGRSGRDVPWSELKFDVSLRPLAANRAVGGGQAQSPLPMFLAGAGVGILLLGGASLLVWRMHQVSRMRADLAASISHELRTPLTHIMLYAESLAKGTDGPTDTQTRAPGVIMRESRRLLHLVENVLEFSRAERREPVTARRRVPLAPLLREVVEGFLPFASAGGSEIQVKDVGDLAIIASRDAVRRMLINYVDNAIRHGPPGRPVTIGAQAIDEYVRISVCDEGTVDDAWLRQAWHRPRDKRTGDTGFGIGLVIVRELARAQGGRCGAERTAAGETCFYVDIPSAPGTRE